MENCFEPFNRSRARILPGACATALAVAVAAVLVQPAAARDITPPRVPPNIEVPAGNRPFFEGLGVGTQNYVCTPSASSSSGFAYVLFTPEAHLFDGEEQLTSHFFSPNPFEENTNASLAAVGPIRATWRHSRDSSTVWAKVRPRDPAIPGDLGDSSSDPAFVKKGAVAWLKLTVVGTQDGPGGGDTLTRTTFIQRVNTSGGVAPATGCASFADVGNEAFMPYSADYIFYTDQ